MSIELKTEYVAAKAISIIKRASDLHSIIWMAMDVQWHVNVIGLISLARWLSITSAEYMSLKELAQVAHGIRHMIIEVIETNPIDITLLMIYLVNADQLQNNNIKTTTLHLQ